MNIIAGERKGTVLFAPEGLDTRPTQAKVRESLFNMIGTYISESRVLDLFAGSGALALEALSRGAASAVCVDHNHTAVKCIRQNIAKLRYEDRCVCVQNDYRVMLQPSAAFSEPYDLVFLDPPYRMLITEECCISLADSGLLHEGALLVLEHSIGSVRMTDPRFTLYKQRAYRDTEIHFYLYQPQEAAE